MDPVGYNELMPRKNVVKEYREKSFYHVYNRGVAKQKIFGDVDDYKKFLGLLKFYLSLQGPTLQVKVAPSKVLKNHSENVSLHSYCLMPNHFHILLYQEKIDSMNFFMRSLATKYVMYFNQRYKRTGPLFESNYKAVRVETDDQLIYLTKYIHRNPIDILPAGMDPVGYKYSSYRNYLRLFKQEWVKINEVLKFFKDKSYKEFVEEENDGSLRIIRDLGIDE